VSNSLSIPSSHLTVGLTNVSHKDKAVATLLKHRRLPDAGWSDMRLRSFLLELSSMDTSSEKTCRHVDDGYYGYGYETEEEEDEDGVLDDNQRLPPKKEQRSSLSSSLPKPSPPRWCGVGEREGRVYSSIVLDRHYGLTHGVGRSGDVTEPQPKAAGSSIIARLACDLVLDAMRRGAGLDGALKKKKGKSRKGRKKKKNEKSKEKEKGDTFEGGDEVCGKNDGGESKEDKKENVRSQRLGGGPATAGLTLPLCTGMSISLILSSIRDALPTEADRRRRNVVLWSRIDQKSCLKAIVAAGMTPIVVPTTIKGDAVVTDMDAMGRLLAEYNNGHGEKELGAILAVVTTTSCFAPRVPDRIDEVAKLCEGFNVAHVINNAYGLQCPEICRLLNRSCVVGRVDAIVCSMDKNFLVPVGEGTFFIIKIIVIIFFFF